ncbi:hypothetical protein IHE45_13G041000 [Dioscorea alata]|uniref:Uncharacterized protein n=1 Tax=Dioscorea alata TaxID=55571 RepID=A0ACB7UXQ8_DIOAL|nr:hypothetical protein IHE45_13G041000 [Dioscorea alata]
MAATWDQAVLILSVPKRKPRDETRETLRTSAFPSAHVKDKWARTCTLHHCAMVVLYLVIYSIG